MIPRIIHYVWVGPKPMSDRTARLIEGWRELMPDYTFMGWNNDNIDFRPKFIRSAFAVSAWNRVSDYQRMRALLEHGGIYLDTDVEVRKNFDPLLNNACFLGFQRREHPTDLVNGAILGAEKGHSYIRGIINYLDEKLHGAVDVDSFAGPGLITHMLQEKGLKAYADEPLKIQDVTVYPLRYFYPYHWEETFSEACITPDTFAVHLWDLTWVRKASARWKIWKKIKRRLDYWLALAAPGLAFRWTMRRVMNAQKAWSS